MNKQAPFTYKQHAYLKRTETSWFNVAEGGKRGGKNVLQTMAFCIALENHPNKIHLVAGVSNATAKLNILDCDGYGLLNFYEGRCREGKYKDRDCLYISTPTGEKVVLISGGGKKGDEKLIKGNTYGMAYVTEANECSETFLKEVFDRTMSSDDRKVFHDLNPKAESHWYYEELLNFHQEKQNNDMNYGYNYGHFTIADNMSVSDEKMKKVLSTYDKGTVWYLRDIKGLRKQAEGLIYPMFDDKQGGKHIVPTIPRNYTEYIVTNDYGTQHPCIFHLYGLFEGVWYQVKEYHHDGSKDGQKTVGEYYNDLKDFVKGLNIKQIYLDNAPIASSFNIYLRKQGEFKSRLSDNNVAEGIQNVATALNTGMLKINDCCKQTIREFGIYSWKENSSEDEPLKENDDNMDCQRYFVQTRRITREKKQSIFERIG